MVDPNRRITSTADLASNRDIAADKDKYDDDDNDDDDDGIEHLFLFWFFFEVWKLIVLNSNLKTRARRSIRNDTTRSHCVCCATKIYSICPRTIQQGLHTLLNHSPYIYIYIYRFDAQGEKPRIRRDIDGEYKKKSIRLVFFFFFF